MDIDPGHVLGERSTDLTEVRRWEPNADRGQKRRWPNRSESAFVVVARAKSTNATLAAAHRTAAPARSLPLSASLQGGRGSIRDRDQREYSGRPSDPGRSRRDRLHHVLVLPRRIAISPEREFSRNDQTIGSLRLHPDRSSDDAARRAAPGTLAYRTRPMRASARHGGGNQSTSQIETGARMVRS